MSVDFKMGCQNDEDDERHPNMRTVSMWSEDTFTTDKDMEPGWGWISMVVLFPYNGSTQNDVITLDISPGSEFAQQIEFFFRSSSDLHTYEICKQLLTAHNSTLTPFGNDYGPIQYGIYDLCAINLNSDSFINLVYWSQHVAAMMSTFRRLDAQSKHPILLVTKHFCTCQMGDHGNLRGEAKQSVATGRNSRNG